MFLIINATLHCHNLKKCWEKDQQKAKAEEGIPEDKYYYDCDVLDAVIVDGDAVVIVDGDDVVVLKEEDDDGTFVLPQLRPILPRPCLGYVSSQNPVQPVFSSTSIGRPVRE